jgi:hypothetical protein
MLAFGVLAMAPAVVSCVWGLISTRASIPPILLRRLLFVYAVLALSLPVALFVLSKFGLNLFGWAMFTGVFALLGAVVATLIAVLTPKREEHAAVHRTMLRALAVAPVVVGLVLNLAHAVKLTRDVRSLASGAPYCVGVYGYGADGRDLYRPAGPYDLTWLSMQMDEVSSIGGNGSYIPGSIAVVEVHRSDNVEYWTFDRHYRQFVNRGSDPNVSFAEPLAQVSGCIPTA